jgi:DNA-binding YbaB/EbfC family protein
MFDKIKELKNLRDQAKQVKETLAQETVQAEAHHGQVSIIMDGNMEVKSTEINSDLLHPDKKEDLEKAIKEATNDAVKKAQRVMAQKMQSMGGLNLPGL